MNSKKDGNFMGIMGYGSIALGGFGVVSFGIYFSTMIKRISGMDIAMFRIGMDIAMCKDRAMAVLEIWGWVFCSRNFIIFLSSRVTKELTYE